MDLWLLQPENTIICSPDAQQAIDKQDVHLRTVSIDEQRRIALLKQDVNVFLADPKNNIVLQYSLMNKPEDVFHDLKRLLSSREQA